MVHIAVAGGTGNVAGEILRSVIASGNHTFTIFTRGEPPASNEEKITYQTIDYTDKESLVGALKGVDVCLSFMLMTSSRTVTAQKNLIDACIEAGVGRFSPSEWGIKNKSSVALYNNKDLTAEYLYEINKESKVLEYSLFQPSMFMDYFAHPHPLSPGLITWPFYIDFNSRQAIILEDGSQPIVLTRIADVSDMLLRAIEDPEPWPPVGGMQGTRTTFAEILALGKKLRPGEWNVEHVKAEDVERGELKTKWVPQMDHPAVPEAQRESFSKMFTIIFLQALLKGAWDVSDEWNVRYPDFKFTSAEEYLAKAWAGKE